MALLVCSCEYHDRPRSAVWLMSGLLSGIIYLAQPVWLPGVVPMVLVALFAHRRLSFGLLYVTGTAAVIVVIRLILDQDSSEGLGAPTDRQSESPVTPCRHFSDGST